MCILCLSEFEKMPQSRGLVAMTMGARLTGLMLVFECCLGIPMPESRSFLGGVPGSEWSRQTSGIHGILGAGGRDLNHRHHQGLQKTFTVDSAAFSLTQRLRGGGSTVVRQPSPLDVALRWQYMLSTDGFFEAHVPRLDFCKLTESPVFCVLSGQRQVSISQSTNPGSNKTVTL
jgi:hypothetical protein